MLFYLSFFFPEKGYDHKKVVKTARNAYQKLVCHLPTTFPTLQSDQHTGFRERTSLVKILGFGLNRAMSESSVDGNIAMRIESSHHTVDSLQKHMLEFTQRLHAAEVDRRDLRIQVRVKAYKGIQNQKYWKRPVLFCGHVAIPHSNLKKKICSSKNGQIWSFILA